MDDPPEGRAVRQAWSPAGHSDLDGLAMQDLTPFFP